MMANIMSGKIQLVASVATLARISVGVSVGIQIYALSVFFITPQIF